MNALFALDTSNYRTSLCLLSEEGRCLWEKRELLKVEAGRRGLRQQEAVFQHLQALPTLMEDFPSGVRLLATAASTRPRPVADSYMPVFEVGRTVAQSIAALHGIPFYATSHQEGHIAAALTEPLTEPFWAVHLSGGTSELLDVRPEDAGYAITVVGGTLDLHAGQLIDRIGVKLGCPFPAGACLEKRAVSFAIKNTGSGAAIRLSPSLKGAYFHLSGAENYFTRCMNEGASPEEVAFALFRYLEETLTRALDHLLSQETRPILLSGGVVANQLLREAWRQTFAGRVPLILAPVSYAGDNALGVARIALAQWRKALQRS